MFHLCFAIVTQDGRDANPANKCMVVRSALVNGIRDRFQRFAMQKLGHFSHHSQDDWSSFWHLCFLDLYSAGTVFICQNLTTADV